MFVHQAARQFEIWTGKPAPWNEMLNVVDRALQDRAVAQNGSAKSTALKNGTKPGRVKGAKTKVS
jgi:3-dehydroquinate dehydratase/shikimate dehydrogenase